MPNVWDSGLRVNIKNTVDTSKIQKLANKMKCEILVGFPSGRQHVQTLHKKNKKSGKKAVYKEYDGKVPTDSMETAELAKMLHFGTAEIPARPFLEDGIKRKQSEIKRALQEEATKAVKGGAPNWDKVGTMAVGAIQEFVRGDYYKTNIPNSQRTIDYKGSDRPLIDGADLINSLVYVKEGN